MKKILVADDDPKIVAALEKRLEANGYDVFAAYDGFAALKLALKEKVDLMLLDIWMPVGVGLSVAERIKAHGLNIPIVFLTASKAPGLSKAAKHLGAAGYLEKPYDPKQLLATIDQALSRQTAAAAA